MRRSNTPCPVCGSADFLPFELVGDEDWGDDEIYYIGSYGAFHRENYDPLIDTEPEKCDTCRRVYCNDLHVQHDYCCGCGTILSGLGE